MSTHLAMWAIRDDIWTHLMVSHDVAPSEVVGSPVDQHRALHPEPPSHGAWQVDDGR